MPAQKKTVSKRVTTKNRPSEKEVAKSYNRYKTYGKTQYTGMSIGRSHKWYYDQGAWRDTKITPDLWGISYAVTKRRAGKAPAGSGALTGTGYHWVILAHQHVEKLNADDYSTIMTGLKFKLAHRRAGKDKWNLTAKSQRKHLITFLKQMIAQLETEPVQLEFEIKNKSYKGEAQPIKAACVNGVCNHYDITLNDEHMGLLRRLKSGWKMDLVEDKTLIRTLGKLLEHPNPALKNKLSKPAGKPNNKHKGSTEKIARKLQIK